MTFLSICSGIEAASCAWHPLGFQPLGFSEIEAFPSAVLKHHYPTIPNFGDLTRYHEWPELQPDILVGGTPCQAFSVAGLRKGLDDPRGNLTLVFLGLVARTRPRWVVWENVPGVLSDATGAFGAMLGGLGELGYGFAYRILDAQHVRVESHPRAVPQRRRRVFVVGHLGDWRRAAAVLFERESLRGDSPPRREAGPSVAALTATGVGTCGADDNQGQAGHLIGYCGEVSRALTACHTATGRQDPNEMEFIALRGESFDASEDGTVRGTPIIATEATAFDWQSGGDARGLDPKETAQLQRSQVPALHHASAVRRLTPRECERLQGFPDDYTRIPYRNKPASECPDGPRYKALGNSMAVNVMRWIGERIQAVEQIP